MLTHPTLEQMHALGLKDMAEAWRDMAEKGQTSELDREEWLALMLDRETATRADRRLTNRLRQARLRFPEACIEDIDFDPARGLDRRNLRELQAAVDLDKEAWAGRVQRLLRRAWRVARAARARGTAVPERLRARFERTYDMLLVEAMAFHEGLPPLRSPGRCGKPKRRKGHNLALRLHERRDEALRFLVHPQQVPFTNAAERDLRMMKLRQKISGGFRSRRDADDFAVLRTVIATAQKQGRDILKTLSGSPESFIENIKYA